MKEDLKRIKELMGLIVEKKVSNDEKYLNYYSDIPRDDFNLIIQADPTTKQDGSMGGYSNWLLRKVKDNKIKKDDLEKAKHLLGLYFKYNKNVDRKNINQIEDLDDLSNEVSKFDNNEFKSNSEKSKDVKKDAEKLYEDEQWLVITPHTEEASCYYGSGTKWCTTSKKSENLFNDYYNQGKLYINIDKKNKTKYQFFFEKYSFKDSANKDIRKPIVETIGMSEGLLNFYKNIVTEKEYNNLLRADILKQIENGNYLNYDKEYMTSDNKIIASNVKVLTDDGKYLTRDGTLYDNSNNIIGKNVDTFLDNGAFLTSDYIYHYPNGGVISQNVDAIINNGSYLTLAGEYKTIDGNIIHNEVKKITDNGGYLTKNDEYYDLRGNLVATNVRFLTSDGQYSVK